MDTTPDFVAVTRCRRLISAGVARKIRIEAGLSLAEMGAAVGKDASTILKWETGRRMPRAANTGPYLALLDRLAAEVSS